MAHSHHRNRTPKRRHPMPMRGRRSRPMRYEPEPIAVEPTNAPELRERLLNRGEITAEHLAQAFIAQWTADRSAGADWLRDEPAPVTATMQLQHQAPMLDVTPADIERGYVDVPAATRISVATTSPDGYEIDLFPRTSFFTAFTVRMAGGSAELGGHGGTLVQRDAPRHQHDAELSFRFMLASGTAPGRYRFPLHILVRPL